MKFNITIYKKDIKNIILKVKNNGKVLLSVPKNTPKKFIDNFLKEKEEWILKNIKKFEDFPLKQVDKSYKNGDNIEYLGIKYTLQIFSNSKNSVAINNQNISINYSGDFSQEKIKKLLYNWYKVQASIIFKETISKYLNLTDETIFQIKIRKMKTKWGSCRPASKIITLNLELIKKPIEAIEYVAFHEVAHLKYPHHKKEFWDFIYLYMKDFKKRKEMLKYV
ncbi:M48 family metallopeptidase [uncultured Cetobacterium sp.]|uniref:M48 family metallopeptidase n=1 Tax=uncultured Cetobacterium sp. TaxID=527638 RepID=UPI00262D83A2|nr:SprT family zinc-dependent metalloprotease [uncultured Cetobacterium sp.]